MYHKIHDNTTNCPCSAGENFTNSHMLSSTPGSLISFIPVWFQDFQFLNTCIKGIGRDATLQETSLNIEEDWPGSAGHFGTSILICDACLGEGPLKPCGVYIFHLLLPLSPGISPVIHLDPIPYQRFNFRVGGFSVFYVASLFL